MFKKYTLSAGLLVSLSLAPLAASAQQPPPAAAPAAPESADALLARVDRQNNAFKDAFFHFKMRIKDPGQVREVEFTTMQKGQKRLVRFLAPADIKGMGFLSESADIMYALLPAFGNRVRRLGTSQMNQNFMGSDLLSSDMNAADLSALFTAKVAGTEGELTVLELAPKAAGLQKQKLFVDGKTALVHKVEYLDDGGKKVRTAVRSDFQKDPSGFLTPGKMVYTDHRRNNHETELVLVKATFNNGYTDDNFSQRALTRN